MPDDRFRKKLRERVEPWCIGTGRMLPGPPGRWVRRVLYRRLVARSGHDIQYSSGVTLTGTGSMHLGDGVKLGPGTALVARGTANRILVGSGTRFVRDVWVDASGGENEVVIGDGAFLGWGVRLSSSGGRSRMSFGSASFLDRGVDIRAHEGGHIEVGEHTYLGAYVCIGGPGAVRIGRHCLIASHSSLYANNHVFADPTRPIAEQGTTSVGITIGDDCWLGSGVRVLDGVVLGTGCVVGAGAVVTTSLPPYSVATGVPARVVRARRGTEIAHGSAPP
jgi:acetyltransferase-like isoleucine patch superfamily enzyme